MTGKEKCSFLKKIRKKIARKNKIPFETEECTAEGPCLGYCPKCDQEAQELEKALQEKKTKKKTKVKVPKQPKDKVILNKEDDRLSKLNDEISMYEKRDQILTEERDCLKEKMQELKQLYSDSQVEEEKKMLEMKADRLFYKLKAVNVDLQRVRETLVQLLDMREREIHNRSHTMGMIAMPAQDENLFFGKNFDKLDLPFKRGLDPFDTTQEQENQEKREETKAVEEKGEDGGQ